MMHTTHPRYHPKFPRPCSGRAGVTIVELMAAVILAAILSSMVFFAWSSIDMHAARSSRSALVCSEANSLVQSIALHVRRSLKVCAWHSAGITFVSHESGDTISYEFSSQGLVTVGKPIPVITPRAYIETFSVALEEEAAGPFGPWVVLALSLTLADSSGMRSTAKTLVAAPRPVGMEAAGLSEWNF